MNPLLYVRERFRRVRRWYYRRLEARRLRRFENVISQKCEAGDSDGATAAALKLIDGYELQANPSCRKCHGRGYVAIKQADRMPLVCRCARAVKEVVPR